MNESTLAIDGLPDPEVTVRAQAPGLAYEQMIDVFLTGYAERPALAERSYTVRVDRVSGEVRREYLPEYRVISYRTLQQQVKALAMAWRNDAELSVGRGEFVCVVGFASVDYAVIDLALAYAKAIPVPLSGHHSASEFKEIFLKTQPVALAVSIAQLPNMVDLVVGHDSIKSLIVFDYDPEITAERRLVKEAARRLGAAVCKIPVLLLQELVSRGRADDFEFLPASATEPDDTALIIHTSGSTGQPKGACILGKALINTWRNVSGPFPKVAMVLAPFHHMMGRDSMVTALNAGGTAYFTQNADLSTLFEDIPLVRPTGLVLFPRICEWIYQHLQNAEPSVARSFLGDRLQSIVVASAPIARRVKKFIEETFRVPVHEGYSSTETSSGGLAMNGFLNRNNVTEYRLRDVPELGYFSTDQPYPRGELCVKTCFGITQYFKNPEATAELFDEDGFSCTGDIVEERGPSQIAIIDRRKNVIKLAQGEFVAVGKLGQIFEENCPLVRQAFVHGDSSRAYLLAVVVIDQDALRQIDPPPATEAEMLALVRSDILRVARERELRNFEIPRDFIIAEEPFTQENGLLSSLGKPIRLAIRSRYQAALEALYEAHETHRQAELDALRNSQVSLSIEERLRVLLSSTLGVHCDEDAQSKSFRELGGDSLAAVQLSVHVAKEFGVSIDGSQILGPRGTISEWARLIRAGQAAPVTGNASGELNSNDFKLETFVPKAPSFSGVGLRPPHTVLLTGASGFLGGRVCLAWLERLAETGGKLICLVRPGAGESASERLEARLARFANPYGKHLEVVAADISESSLGLDTSIYDRLAREVDVICHCAALVNHRLAYEHVFRPNVLGTAEVIRFALTHKRKSIDFVSSIGVTSLATKTAPEPGRLRLDDAYASGYFASKWACEHLLWSTHQTTGLPIRVVRPALILPDRQWIGEMNPDDILSRLIYSICITGLAPESFASGNFHAGGLPVDQLAEAIVALGDDASEGFHLLNLGGNAGDAFPLNAMLNCLESSGLPLKRIPNYEEWSRQIEQALSSLPANQKSQSMLDILEAYQTQDANEPTLCSEQSDSVFSEAYLRKYLGDFSARGLV